MRQCRTFCKIRWTNLCFFLIHVMFCIMSTPMPTEMNHKLRKQFRFASTHPYQTLTQWARVTRSNFVDLGNYRVTCANWARLWFEGLLPMKHTQVLKVSMIIQEDDLKMLYKKTKTVLDIHDNYLSIIRITALIALYNWWSRKFIWKQ